MSNPIIRIIKEQCYKRVEFTVGYFPLILRSYDLLGIKFYCNPLFFMSTRKLLTIVKKKSTTKNYTPC